MSYFVWTLLFSQAVRCCEYINIDEFPNIQSDSYPDEYGKSLDQCWVLSAENRIHLEFRHFETEEAFDYVNIYDGSSMASSLLGTFSGDYTYGNTLNSSGNELTIMFHTDGSTQLSGFDFRVCLLTSGWCEDILPEEEEEGNSQTSLIAGMAAVSFITTGGILFYLYKKNQKSVQKTKPAVDVPVDPSVPVTEPPLPSTDNNQIVPPTYTPATDGQLTAAPNGPPAYDIAIMKPSPLHVGYMPSVPSQPFTLLSCPDPLPEFRQTSYPYPTDVRCTGQELSAVRMASISHGDCLSSPSINREHLP